MNNLDLQKEFIYSLYEKIPRQAELIDTLAATLSMEKESVYRRLTGRVNFNIHEMGLIARELSISIDNLLYHDKDFVLLPTSLASPMQFTSMESLYTCIEKMINRLEFITQEKTENGNVMNMLPLEFYSPYPHLTKFMFYKWNQYFVRTNDYLSYSDWEMPEKLTQLGNRALNITNFDTNFYIWDQSIIWNLVHEIASMHRIGAITDEEQKIIAEEIRKMLVTLEMILSSRIKPNGIPERKGSFYLSSVNLGFTSSYWVSEKGNSASFFTNFSYAMINDNQKNILYIRDWINYLRNISTLISNSGQTERRLFFKLQNELINKIL